MGNNKKILVTGSNGQLGKTLQKRCLDKNGFDWVFLPKDKLDITEKEEIQAAYKKHNPNFCINCAAFTNVLKSEKEPLLAYKINVEGVKSQPDGSLIIDGSVTIRDLNRSLAWDLPDENYNTIAGLVVFETKTIPNPGQEFRLFGIKIRILQKDKNFLSKLRLWKEQEK